MKPGTRIRSGCAIAITLLLSLGLGLVLSAGSPSPAAGFVPSQPQQFVAFSAFVNGNRDIYAFELETGSLFRLTSDPAPDVEPALSPDGDRLAFSSRRDGNWEIYLLDRDGALTRLTHNTHYDGDPAWSPDGQYIAFESYRAWDIDIWVMRADGSEKRNLTPRVPAGDCDPAWSPDGRFIAFSSWRYGDKDIFLIEVETGETIQLTNATTDEDSPAWSPDGRYIAYVKEDNERREVWVLDVQTPPARGGQARRITWLTRDEAPVWLPDGRLVFVSQRYDGGRLMLRGRNPAEVPSELLGPARLGHKLTFARSIPAGAGSLPISGIEIGRPASKPASHKLVRLPGVRVYKAELSDAVAESFQKLRERVRDESGYDFLGRLSEALRPPDFHSDYSEYASWHKAGRAFDTLLDFRSRSGLPLMEVTREDTAGETRWRIFVRCARQDGTCGRPLETRPWDFSYRARAIVAPEEGGLKKFVPYGYYVDFTRMAEELGWERISAHDDEDFSWRWHFKAVEYWHYQRRDGLTWYQAMLELYPREEVEDLFSWDLVIERGTKPYIAFAKGIPLPPSGWKWHLLRP